MRITIVIPFISFSGGTRVVAVHAEGLRKRGHEVVVITTPGTTPSLKNRLGILLREGRWLPARQAEGPYFEGSGVEIRSLDRFRPVTDADVPDADVVLATYWRTAEGVVALSPSKGVRAILVQGYEAAAGSDSSALDAVWRLPLQKIVVSRWLRDLSARSFGDPGALLVPNGVDADLFQAPVRGKSDVPTVGLIYSTSSMKGVDVALEAFRRARQRLPSLRLLAFGAEPLAAELPLPEGAEYHYRPSQDRIPGLYARCDAWIWTSRSEGFGLPLLEAMACRTPVIAAPTGAGPELVEQGGGLAVPAEDPAATADAVVRICSLPDEEWRRLSETARTVAVRHRWEESTERLERALVETRRRAAARTGAELSA